MKRRSGNWTGIIWFILILVIGNLGLMSSVFSTNTNTQTEAVTEDTYMTTNQYHVDLTVREDNSYDIKENLAVTFDSYRHGIYRYVPYRGVITESDDMGQLTDTPYYAWIEDVEASVPIEVTSDIGNEVLRLGDEEMEVIGDQTYDISYHVQPVTSNGYENVYWNIYPVGWRTDIPAGSTFAITFPKDFNHENLILYYGSYGEQKDGLNIVDVSWNGNTLTGSLKEALPVGNGMTVFVPMEEGYFTNVATTGPYNTVLIVMSAIVLVILLLMFFFFGRDEQIIPSVQFQPPKGLDSAAVGYIIDGSISNKDIVSLLVYWADRGYLKIKEKDNDSLSFKKLKNLPKDSPEYATVLFNEIFANGKEVAVDDMKYRLADTMASVRTLMQKQYKKRIYTGASKKARAFGVVLAMIPVCVLVLILVVMTFASALILVFPILYLIGLLLFNHTVDTWYARARGLQRLWGSLATGLCVLPYVMLFLFQGIRMLRGEMLNFAPAMIAVIIVSLLAVPLIGFMKKRTSECISWMGFLAGLRDFIETAELDRMKFLAKDDPHLFYHILPFAYVFGLSDVMLDKMKDLTLPAPEWYETRSTSTDTDTFFNYYLMRQMFHTNMTQVAQTISTPKPAESSSSGSKFGGGDFGGFSGGGFSGGGFGGGGGGSW